MEEIATIMFKDCDSGSDAAAIVRRGASVVALCLTIEGNGDVEVVMNDQDARRLLSALQTALSRVKA